VKRPWLHKFREVWKKMAAEGEFYFEADKEPAATAGIPIIVGDKGTTPVVGESTPLVRRSSSSGLKEREISAVNEVDDKGLVEWSWRESMCCETGKNKVAGGLLVCSLSPFLLLAFTVTLLGKVVHDLYGQGMPLRRAETLWERKIRVQGILTTTGLQIIIIIISLVILIRRYFQFRIEGTFDDIATVYLRTLVTVASSVNVIFSNIIFLNAVRSKWQQTINLFILGSYAIVLSQVAMGTFDSWILLTGDYTFTDVIFCVLHFAETLYSAIQCILYQTMWNYYIDATRPNVTDEGELVASTNIVMLTLVNWASLLISFRFTSISDYLARRVNSR